MNPDEWAQQVIDEVKDCFLKGNALGTIYPQAEPLWKEAIASALAEAKRQGMEDAAKIAESYEGEALSFSEDHHRAYAERKFYTEWIATAIRQAAAGSE